MAEKTLEEMREAVEEIRAKMAAAAREAGRDPAAVQLCAACKTRTADIVAASAALPIDVFGENHVQELCANFDAGAYCGKPSHFIGHLQTNKIKKVLGRASLIQSVDSEHLLAAIEKEAANAFVHYRDPDQPPRIDGQRKHHRADPVRVSVDDAVGDGF